MKIKKKTITIIITLVVLAIILAILVGVVLPIIKVNQTNNKLSKINAKEFQTKLIARLEKSPLNVNTETTKTEFRVLDETKTKVEKIINLGYETVDAYNSEVLKNNKKTDRPYNVFISAFITDKNDDSVGVAIPCFLIKSDNNGNLKNIEYLDGSYTEYSFIGAIIRCEIENVLKTEYDINTDVLNSLIYKDNKNINFKSNNDIMNMYFSNEETLIEIFNAISNNMGNSYGAYSFKAGELEREKDNILNEYKVVVKINTLLMSVN